MKIEKKGQRQSFIWRGVHKPSAKQRFDFYISRDPFLTDSKFSILKTLQIIAIFIYGGDNSGVKKPSPVSINYVYEMISRFHRKIQWPDFSQENSSASRKPVKVDETMSTTTARVKEEAIYHLSNRTGVLHIVAVRENIEECFLPL